MEQLSPLCVARNRSRRDRIRMGSERSGNKNQRRLGTSIPPPRLASKERTRTWGTGLGTRKRTNSREVGHHDLQHHFSEERDEGMHTFEISRREVIVGGAATVALAAMGVARPALAPGTLTVQQVLDRMKLNVGGPWREGRTVDRIIAGSADMEVTGIGTMMMATFDALKDAVKA